MKGRGGFGHREQLSTELVNECFIKCRRRARTLHGGKNTSKLVFLGSKIRKLPEQVVEERHRGSEGSKGSGGSVDR
jgi:hypothetical protein